jgi:chemotaxis protein MotB
VARKRAHEHADERWLLTYADMITLLMALFMVLFSMAVVNKGKFDELARSLKESFSGPLGPGGDSILSVGAPVPAPNDTPQPDPLPPIAEGTKPPEPAVTEEGKKVLERAQAAAVAQDASLQDAKARIDAKVEELGLEDQVQTQIRSDGLVIRLLTDKVLFDVGSADIRPGTGPLLGAVAQAINAVNNNPIRVSGHTDAIPFEGDPHGNTQLSADRAVAVYSYLVDHGLSERAHPDTAIQGFGDRRPLTPNDPKTGAGTRNRRVEVVVEKVDFVGEAQAAVRGALGPNPVGIPEVVPESPQIHP